MDSHTWTHTHTHLPEGHTGGRKIVGIKELCLHPRFKCSACPQWWAVWKEHWLCNLLKKIQAKICTYSLVGGGAGRECVHATLCVWVRGQFSMVSSLLQVLETGTQFASLAVRTCTHQTISSALNTWILILAMNPPHPRFFLHEAEKILWEGWVLIIGRYSRQSLGCHPFCRLGDRGCYSGAFLFSSKKGTERPSLTMLM